MRKQVTILTGATSGIGLQTAKDLVKKNHHLILGNRNQDKAKKVKQELLEIESNAEIDLLELDLSSIESIKKFVSEIYKNYEVVDVLINNAGLFMDTNKYTAEGFEMTMGVNYLGTYLVTELLLDKLRKKSVSKIIMISSAASYYGRLWLKKDFFKRHKSGFLGYSDSKLALMVYTQALSNKLKDSNIIVKAVHPGDIYTGIWKGETKMMALAAKMKQKGKKTVEEGALVGVMMATSDVFDATPHIFYKFNQKPMKMPRKSRRSKFVNRFMEYTEKTLQSL